jgi:hypothetical protein
MLERRQPSGSRAAPSSAAERRRALDCERQRRARARHRHGRAVLYVEVPNFYRLIEAMIVSGRLRDVEGLRRDLVEREAAEILDDWARRWLAKESRVTPAGR